MTLETWGVASFCLNIYVPRWIKPTQFLEKGVWVMECGDFVFDMMAMMDPITYIMIRFT